MGTSSKELTVTYYVRARRRKNINPQASKPIRNQIPTPIKWTNHRGRTRRQGEPGLEAKGFEVEGGVMDVREGQCTKEPVQTTPTTIDRSKRNTVNGKKISDETNSERTQQ